MKSDTDIKRDVEEELRFDPDIDATDIGVAVKDGVVTLVGFVKSYTEKFEAEAAAAHGGAATEARGERNSLSRFLSQHDS